MSLSEASLTALRVLVKDIGVQLAGLSALHTPEGADLTERLRSSWTKVVEVLDLGQEPELRECPVCHHHGLRAATVCGYCWTKLIPLRAHTDADVPPQVVA